MKDFIIKHLLISTHSCRVASNKSDVSYKKIEEAIEYNFIQFGTKRWLSAISMDLDYQITYNEIADICNRVEIPLPTLFVETTKGVHLHWALKYPIDTTKGVQRNLYKKIAQTLRAIFDADRFAVPMSSGGRLWRNPLKHPHKFVKSFVELSTFSHLLPDSSSTKLYTRSHGVSKKRVLEAKVGERNNLLFDYLRKLAYRNRELGTDGLDKLLITEAKSINKCFPEQLPYEELCSIVNSILRFMENDYEGSTDNEATIEFNRKLAKNKQKATKRKIVAGIFSNPFIPVSQLKRLSSRRLGRLLNVSHTTINKYKDELLKLLEEFLPNVEAPVAKFTDFVKYIELFFIKSIEDYTMIKDTS